MRIGADGMGWGEERIRSMETQGKGGRAQNRVSESIWCETKKFQSGTHFNF